MEKKNFIKVDVQGYCRTIVSITTKQGNTHNITLTSSYTSNGYKKTLFCEIENYSDKSLRVYLGKRDIAVVKLKEEFGKPFITVSKHQLSANEIDRVLNQYGFNSKNRIDNRGLEDKGFYWNLGDENEIKGINGYCKFMGYEKSKGFDIKDKNGKIVLSCVDITNEDGSITKEWWGRFDFHKHVDYTGLLYKLEGWYMSKDIMIMYGFKSTAFSRIMRAFGFPYEFRIETRYVDDRWQYVIADELGINDWLDDHYLADEKEIRRGLLIGDRDSKDVKIRSLWKNGEEVFGIAIIKTLIDGFPMYYKRWFYDESAHLTLKDIYVFFILNGIKPRVTEYNKDYFYGEFSHKDLDAKLSDELSQDLKATIHHLKSDSDTVYELAYLDKIDDKKFHYTVAHRINEMKPSDVWDRQFNEDLIKDPHSFKISGEELSYTIHKLIK